MAEEGSSEELTPAGDAEETAWVLTPEQEQCLEHIRVWVETEAEFYGRTDDEFLRMFLFGCKFNLENIKKKMCKYYDYRRKLPQWWASRDLKDPELLSLLHLKASIVFKDRGRNHSVIHFSKLSRFVEALDGKKFDLWLKICAANMEVIMRRMGTQTQGMHWILDAADMPSWIISRLFSPIFLRDLITSFILALPVRVKSITWVNSPLIINTIWVLARPFFTQKLRNRVHIYRSDWTQLFEHIDRDGIPEEYGGNAGPLCLHDDAYINEFLSYTEYFSEDNQYGYQTED